MLERGPELVPHTLADVAVDAVHSGDLMAHPLGLQDLGNAVLVHPRLMAMSEAVRSQATQHGQPRRERDIVGRLLP